MKPSTKWMLIVSVFATGALACFCSGDRIEEYEVEIEKDNGGNSDNGYYLITPKPILPLAVGTSIDLALYDWEDINEHDRFDNPEMTTTDGLEIQSVSEILSRITAKAEGMHAIKIDGVTDTVKRQDAFQINAVNPSKLAIEGQCGYKVLAAGIEQLVSLRFKTDTSKTTLAYGKGYYPLSFDESVEVDADRSTFYAMHLNVPSMIADEVIMTDELDENKSTTTFKTTQSKAVVSMTYITPDEYSNKSMQHPFVTHMVLKATLDDGNIICPAGQVEVTSQSPYTCAVQLINDFPDDATVTADIQDILIVSKSAGECILDVVLKNGLKNLASTRVAFDIQPPNPRETETRTRTVPRGGGGD